MAPVSLNIVCYRFQCEDADTVNAAIAADVQESGIAAPSTTQLAEGLAIRAALVNHRTQLADINALVDAVLAFGRSRNGR
jgi:aromatic-L-amino-acid decarboxylase